MESLDTTGNKKKNNQDHVAIIHVFVRLKYIAVDFQLGQY